MSISKILKNKSDHKRTCNQELRVYLREHGWEESCDHPGNLWLWHKEIESKSYCVDFKTAIWLQEALECTAY